MRRFISRLLNVFRGDDAARGLLIGGEEAAGGGGGGNEGQRHEEGGEKASQGHGLGVVQREEGRG